MRNLVVFLFLLVGCQNPASPAQSVAGSAESIFLPGKTYILFVSGNPAVKVIKTRSDGWFLAENRDCEQCWYNANAIWGAQEVR